MAKQLRVLELGSGVSAAHAAKLLADHGANVIKVETPAGDRTRWAGPYPGAEQHPEKSGTFLALNLNKRGVCLDLDSEKGQAELSRLICWANIVVHNFPPSKAERLGLDQATLMAEHPSLVVLSITPFGNTGPHRNFKATDLTLTNAGGWASICPATKETADLPPLKVYGEQCGLMAGIAGAFAALSTYRDTRRTGIGDYIDLSEQEYVASVLEAGIPYYSYAGQVATRYGQRSLIPWKIFHASDGPIFLVCIEQDQWERLVEFMGNPEWATIELFADHPGRMENQDIIHTFVQEFISEWQLDDLYHEAQKHRLCFAPILSIAEVAANEHLRARDFFLHIDHPETGAIEYPAPPAITSSGRSTIHRPAPLLGQHTEEVFETINQAEPLNPDANAVARRPLEGLRVIDLTWVWAGTYCTLNMAHLGAEVIRLESEGRSDFYRRSGPYPPGVEPELNKSGHFNQWNQGKHSVAVDLGSQEGIALVKEFITNSDVVVQNFATGVMERLGLGYEELKKLNPKIILASISGYGQSGPYREYMGYGPAIASLTGLSAVTGYVGGEPEELGLSMPDPTVGITAAFAVVSALERRDQTGEGDHLDISLWEASTVLNVDAWMQYALNGTQPDRQGNRDRNMSPHGCFPCMGEDQWVSIACADDSDWKKLSAAINPDLLNDSRFETLTDRKSNEDALETIVSEWTLEKDRWEITYQLQEQGIAAFPTLTCRDVVDDPHLNARDFIERLNHPEVGARAHAGVPWRLMQRPNGVRSPAPCLGEHTNSLLSEILGYDEVKIAQLNDKGILN
jgi:crotonobetainyl-CoA:carnitine CoA-transferase CaiB-like acyl-CoA transferase